MGSEQSRPDGKIGLATPPKLQSKPLRLRMIFIDGSSVHLVCHSERSEESLVGEYGFFAALRMRMRYPCYYPPNRFGKIVVTIIKAVKIVITTVVIHATVLKIGPLT